MSSRSTVERARLISSAVVFDPYGVNRILVARAMSQGVVTKYLFDLITKQVEDRKLVVWYDPEQVYADAAAELDLPGTTLARYDGSFFKLRHELEHLMNDEQPPRLVVYVPLGQADTHHALCELEAAGVVMQPGQQPPNRNTRLALVARNALKPIVGEETAAEIERQAESGTLTLAEVNKLAGKGKEISTGVLSLIFGSANLRMWPWRFWAAPNATARSRRNRPTRNC